MIPAWIYLVPAALIASAVWVLAAGICAGGRERREPVPAPAPLPRRQRVMPPGHPDRAARLTILEQQAFAVIRAMYETEGEIR